MVVGAFSWGSLPRLTKVGLRGGSPRNHKKAKAAKRARKITRK